MEDIIEEIKRRYSDTALLVDIMKAESDKERGKLIGKYELIREIEMLIKHGVKYSERNK